jgi:hypothetical protein
MTLTAVLLLSTTAITFAQTAAGTIHGTVLDPSGALVPRARVTISNATGYSKTIKSGPSGAFELSRLTPGSYSISINATGFTPALEGGVRVVKDRITRENIKLGISVDQFIEVLANTNAVPSTRSRASL